MKQKLLTITCLFFIFTTSLCAQKIDSLVYFARKALQEDRYEDSRKYYDTLLKAKSFDSLALAEIYYGIAESYYWQKDDNKSAETYYLKVKDHINLPSSEFNYTLLRATTRLAYLYKYRTSKNKKALVQFLEENDIISQHPNQKEISETRKFRNAYNLASNYRLLNNYERALNFAFESLSIAKEQENENAGRRNQTFAYSVIANTLGDMERHDEATQYYLKKIEQTIELYGPTDLSVANDYNNIGINYIDIGEFDKAKAYIAKAIKILEVDDPERRFLSNAYRQMGIALAGTNDFALSESYFNKAIAIIQEPLPTQSALAFRSLAELYEKQHMFDTALVSYQRAIGSIFPDFEWQSPEENPRTERSFTEPLYYTLLNMKAACWLAKYKVSGNQTDLTHANEAFKLMDELTDTYRNNFTLESSKLFFQDWNYEHYVDALESVYEMNLVEKSNDQTEQAWALIEKNKSMLLLENLLSAERIEGTNIPDSVMELQALASQNIWNLQRDILDCELKQNCDESALIKLRSELSKSERTLEETRKTIRAEYPDYYSITQEEAIVSLDQMRKQLKSNQLIINYFATDSAYFALAANNKHVRFEKILRSQKLDSVLSVFLNECSGNTLDKGNLKESYENFTKSAHYVFQNLLAPLLDDNEVDELIIIPDGLLALTPFEAMISALPGTNSVSFSKLNYLINSYKVQYGYSATLWLKNKNAQALNASSTILALGTSGERSRTQLAQLKGTKAEAAALELMPNSTVLIGDIATEQNFKLSSQEADIIHLAMHNINDQTNPLNSRLIFSDSAGLEDGDLHLYELFGMKLNPKLVVLSACETGVSEWKKGEGPYHIGRGFLYHGNPAMILSLWKVRDKTASELMKKLYDKLYSGANSIEALRRAKLEWLSTSDELTSHPSNWAAFVGIGQVSKNSGGTPWGFALLVVLGILVLVFAKFRQKHT